MDNQNNNMIQVEILSRNETIKIPAYATEGAAGLDLYVDNFKNWDNQTKEIKILTNGEGKEAESIKLRPGYRVLVGTGIKVAIPVGFELQIRSRSGLALKQGIIVLNSPGTIDSDYRGEIGIIIMNTGHDEVIISKGDAVGQAVLKKVERVQWKPVTQLSDTVRSEGGFGSTS